MPDLFCGNDLWVSYEHSKKYRYYGCIPVSMCISLFAFREGSSRPLLDKGTWCLWGFTRGTQLLKSLCRVKYLTWINKKSCEKYASLWLSPNRHLWPEPAVTTNWKVRLRVFSWCQRNYDSEHWIGVTIRLTRCFFMFCWAVWCVCLIASCMALSRQ